MADPTVDMKSLEELFDCKLRPLFGKFDNLNLRVDEAISSLTFLSGKYDELNEKVIKLEDNDKVFKSENTFLQHELVKLKEDNKILKDVQDELEQYGRRECLEIRGIPITTDEDTNAIVIKLASKIGVQVKEEDISVSHRLANPQSNNTASSGNCMAPAIIVKFVRRDIRDKPAGIFRGWRVAGSG